MSIPKIMNRTQSHNVNISISAATHQGRRDGVAQAQGAGVQRSIDLDVDARLVQRANHIYRYGVPRRIPAHVICASDTRRQAVHHTNRFVLCSGA